MSKEESRKEKEERKQQVQQSLFKKQQLKIRLQPKEEEVLREFPEDVKKTL